MAEIVHIDDYRPDVLYTIHFCHGYDGSLSMCIEDASDDQASKLAIASALLRGGRMLANEVGMSVEELLRECV